MILFHFCKLGFAQQIPTKMFPYENKGTIGLCILQFVPKLLPAMSIRICHVKVHNCIYQVIQTKIQK